MRKLLYLLLLSPIMLLSQENESFLLNLSEITVKSGHNAQFIRRREVLEKMLYR